MWLCINYICLNHSYQTPKLACYSCSFVFISFASLCVLNHLHLRQQRQFFFSLSRLFQCLRGAKQLKALRVFYHINYDNESSHRSLTMFFNKLPTYIYVYNIHFCHWEVCFWTYLYIKAVISFCCPSLLGTSVYVRYNYPCWNNLQLILLVNQNCHGKTWKHRSIAKLCIYFFYNFKL